jgi:hypothetical protein
MSSIAPSPPLVSESMKNGLAINIGVSGAFGLIFNLLLSWVLVKKVRKRGVHGDIILCAFIAITDVILSLALITRSIISRYPYNLIKVHPKWCKFDIGFTTQLLVYSGYSLGVMSFERFLLICFNIKLSVCVWFLMIGIVWGSQFSLAMISISQDMQLLSKTEVQCTFIPQKISYYLYILAVTYLFSTFTLIVTCYCCIMIAKFRQCLNQISLNVPKNQVYSELRSTFIKSIANIILFLIVYMPKIFVSAYELLTGRNRTIFMDIISNSTIVYSPAVNALMLIYMNQEVRNSFIRLLKDIKLFFIK